VQQSLAGILGRESARRGKALALHAFGPTAG
jgi:hypothetical protein